MKNLLFFIKKNDGVWREIEHDLNYDMANFQNIKLNVHENEYRKKKKLFSPTLTQLKMKTFFTKLPYNK